MQKEEVIGQFQQVRQQTEALCQSLAIEDYVIQSVEDVSPPKWHLAHSTWFFETFVLAKFMMNYKPFDPSFSSLFNSYYQGIGNPYPRAKRGLLSRPTVNTIYRYRQQIDHAALTFLQQAKENQLEEIISLFILGLNHEQQHQELLLMDIKQNFSMDPNYPCYKSTNKASITLSASPLKFIGMEGGLVDTGCQSDTFCFDNELPVHKNFLVPYLIANRLITNGEYLEFINDGGYQNPQWWLADGWDCITKNSWLSPLYWHYGDHEWYIFTLNGIKPLDYSEPVSHISYYEAEAFARWFGARLATEIEWEHFVHSNHLTLEKANVLETNLFHPCAAFVSKQEHALQFFGDLWEWTASPYTAYPGYQPLSGKLGEYNGKFMANQMVLRGGCCATPSTQIRSSYRNFFQPDKRWQFSGIRLAKNF